jgi:hypothetical protein
VADRALRARSCSTSPHLAFLQPDLQLWVLAALAAGG